MTKHDLKELAAMGAELGAAKAENEKLRGLLRDVNDVFDGQHPAPGLVIDRVRNTLAQQAEPKCCEYCDGTGDVHRADGEWLGECKECDSAEPAPAQDEREVARTAPDRIYLVIGEECPADASFHELADVTWCEDDIGNMIRAHIGNLKAGKEQAESYARKWAAEADLLRKDAERWRYVRLQGDDTHWLNLLRVDLDDFGGNINAAVDALIDGDTPAMAAKEA